MRHVSIFLAAALAVPVHAAPYQHMMTGEQFATALARQPHDAFWYAQRERAYAYLDGVKDAMMGNGWCPLQPPTKTFEQAYDAADYIRTLPVAQRQGSAAPLLLAYLSAHYPCHRSR